jgi:hypothetical protein
MTARAVELDSRRLDRPDRTVLLGDGGDLVSFSSVVRIQTDRGQI